MMKEQVITLVRIPIKDIEEWMRTKHDLPSILSEFRLEEDNLVLSFYENEKSEDLSLQASTNPSRRRRARRKRNRMKTRGWAVVARFTNSKGQKCAIYEPFVTALVDKQLTVEEQKKTVEKILRSNRNRPSDESIQYFLDNTLEYLRKRPHE
jgi:hypothetical protein